MRKKSKNLIHIYIYIHEILTKSTSKTKIQVKVSVAQSIKFDHKFCVCLDSRFHVKLKIKHFQDPIDLKIIAI